MWKFWQTPLVVPIPNKVRLALEQRCGVNDHRAESLRMVQARGRYSGRKVTYFRVFDPAALQASSDDLRHFRDLYPRQVLYSGHIESNGQIVLNR